jgi:hypothetical protein
MHEYEDLEDLDRTGQGDVIKWVEGELLRPWQVFGVVVTADCDLAHEKHGGVISFVPAMLTEDFIWHHWRLERLGPKLDEFLTKAGSRIASWRSKNGGTDFAPSVAATRKWLERSGADGILDEIGVADLGQRNSILNVIKPAADVLNVINGDAPDLTQLSAAYAFVNPKAATDPTAMATDIQRTWASLPGDIFHLPSVPKEEEVPGGGLFLHLRHIRQIGADEISARPDDIRSGKAKVRRVARVCAPYRYAITQALARVFSDIGLPDDYEARRKDAAQRFFNPEATS